MMEFPKSIKDGDIELVKLDATFENATMLFELVNKNREFLGKWLEWVDFVKTPEDEFGKVQSVAKPDSPEYFILYNGKLAGVTGFASVKEKHGFGEIGYFLGEEFTGQGIMTRAVKLCEKLGFENMNLNRVEIRTDVENKPSAAIPERLGYVLEGILRQTFKLRGVSRDIFVFSKLKSEWEKENKNA